jgi:hypothetical protein
MKKLPAALLVGLAMYVLHDLAALVFRVMPMSPRWAIAAFGLELASYVLITVGLHDLAHRTPKPALRAAWVLLAIAALWGWAQPIVEMFSGYMPWDSPWFGYANIASGALVTASAVALVVAADGVKRAPIASVLVVLAVLGRGWFPAVGDALNGFLGYSMGLAGLYVLVNGLMWCGGLFVLARHVSVESEPDVKTAVSGLRIVERSLKLRAVFAIAALAVGLGAAPAWNTSKVFAIGLPVLSLATLVIVGLGCLRLARAKLENQSSMQTVIGGALVLWWCALNLQRSAFPYGLDAIAETWSLVGPLALAAGFVVVGMDVLKSLPALREVLAARMVAFIALSIVAILIQSGVVEATLRTHIALGFVAAFANIGAALAFASLAGRAADAIGKPAVPEARVVSTSQP